MTAKEFREAAFSYALEQGCDAAETYYESGESFSCNADGGEIDRYAVSRRSGLSLRVQLGGRDGYAYTECLEEPERLVRQAMDNAEAIESADEHPMQGRCTYKKTQPAENALAAMTEENRIALALDLEARLLRADKRVQRAVHCTVGAATGEVAIHNTLGLTAERRETVGYCYTEPLVKKGTEVRTGFAFRMGAEAADAAGCAKEAVLQAVEKLGAKPVASGDYRILLKTEAASDLLSAFLPMFSADEAQKGCSLLAGREGERIAAPIVSIVDDPFHPIAPRAFDGEGTPCKKKAVVQDGVLKTLLHNLKTARKAGVKSTGNARRASAASPVGVGPTVFYVEPGKTDFEALRENLADGLVITELEGLHAGLSTISGDFSLKAEGFLVRGGTRIQPVSQVTVAGNFLTMMQAVEAVGSDLKFPFSGGDFVASPSLLIKTLAVAGE